MKKLSNIIFALLAGLTVAAVVFAWTNPPGNPPTGGGAFGSLSNAPANSVYVDSLGRVGVGTTNPGAMLQINGQIKITGGSPAAGKVLMSDDATGLASWQALPASLPSGTAGQTLRSNGISWLASSVLSNDDTKLTINGTVDNLLTLSRSGATNSTIFKVGTDSAFIIDSGGVANALTIKSGKVGIGATGPQAILHIQTDTSSKNLLYAVNSVGSRILLIDGLGKFKYGNASGSGSADATLVEFAGNTISTTDYMVINPASDNTGNLLHVQKAGSSKFVVNSDGNVGIGTTTPGAKLQIGITGTEDSIRLSNDSLNHGMTGIAPTNVFGRINEAIAALGGLSLIGLSREGVSIKGFVSPGLIMGGILGYDDPIDSIPAVLITGNKKNGTSRQKLGDTETVFQIKSGDEKLLTILGGGNVGIGTTGSQIKTHIKGDSNGPSSSGSVSQGNLLLQSGGTFGLALGTFDSGSQYGWIQAQYVDSAGATRSLALNPIGGNVGIGTTEPNNKLQVANLINFDDVRYSTLLGSGVSAQGMYNTAVGYQALKVNTDDYNTAVGYQALKFSKYGEKNTALGYKADVFLNNLYNTIVIGYEATVASSNKAVIGNSNITTIGGYGAWTNYSDERLKENIFYKNNLGLNFITRLNPVSFNYKDDENKRRRDGLIAQDVQKVLNDLGLEFSGLIIDNDEQKTMNLSYGEFVIPLINAVKEQQIQIKELETRLKKLEQK